MRYRTLQPWRRFISNVLCDSSGSYYTCLRSVRVVLTDTGALFMVLQGHISHGLLQASSSASVFQQQNLEQRSRDLTQCKCTTALLDLRQYYPVEITAILLAANVKEETMSTVWICGGLGAPQPLKWGTSRSNSLLWPVSQTRSAVVLLAWISLWKHTLGRHHF